MPRSWCSMPSGYSAGCGKSRTPRRCIKCKPPSRGRPREQLPSLDLIQAKCLVETTHNSLRSALRCGIREGRCSNQVTDVGAPVTGDEAFRDTGGHGAVRGARLVR
jgi:hypothetical protein